MNINLNKSLLLSIPVVLFMASCKKDKKDEVTPENPTTPSYNVPTTYNFASVDFSSSTNRITMLGEITGYIRTTHTATVTTGATLNAQTLKDMYANANNTFTTSGLNSSGIQLKDKTGNAYSLQTSLETSFDNAATASVYAATTPTNTTASNGVAGKLISGTKAYLVDANGFEFKEVAEKGIMGGVFYYQGTTILANIASYDNTALVGGLTAQEKAWDEAFGYFGIPTAFPTSTVGVKNWGSYCNAVSNSLDAPNVNSSSSVNVTIMNAWLKGRAAISNKDNAGRDAARDIVLQTWEKVAAARFITYVKSAKTNIADDALRSHNLSEGVGFIQAFRYNPSKTITDAQIAQLLGYIGNNLYTVSTTNLDNAISTMASIFGLDSSKL